MTQFAGFKKFGDEYKLMGLAPYGKPLYFDKLKNLFYNNNKLFELNLKYFRHHQVNFNYSHLSSENFSNIYSQELSDLFKDEIENNKSEDFRKNFASSVQKVYEEYFKKILDDIDNNNFSKNLVFAGGCALNSSANNFIISKKFSKNIFIPFAPGDNGGSLGAAFYVCKKRIKNNNFNNPFIGNFYSDIEIERIIYEKFSNKIDFKKFMSESEKLNFASELIINEGVIGWFQDKMEFGPRALGNRSILADPRNPKVKDLINKK